MYFFIDDVKFFARSGRVSGINAKMGNLFGSNRFIYMREEGEMETKGKTIGRKKKLMQYSITEELGDEVKTRPLVMGHTGF